MTRMGKQEERRNRCPYKRKNPSKKTGPKKDNLPTGFKEHTNAAPKEIAKEIFVPKVKNYV